MPTTEKTCAHRSRLYGRDGVISCSRCGKVLEIQKKSPPCPKCGKPTKRIGLRDWCKACQETFVPATLGSAPFCPICYKDDQTTVQPPVQYGGGISSGRGVYCKRCHCQFTHPEDAKRNRRSTSVTATAPSTPAPSTTQYPPSWSDEDEFGVGGWEGSGRGCYGGYSSGYGTTNYGRDGVCSECGSKVTIYGKSSTAYCTQCAKSTDAWAKDPKPFLVQEEI